MHEHPAGPAGTPRCALARPAGLPACPCRAPVPAACAQRLPARLLRPAPCRGPGLRHSPAAHCPSYHNTIFVLRYKFFFPSQPSCHNTKHCIAIQFHAVQSLAILILQYNPSLYKPQSQYKILYCNTNSPQISFSLQYNPFSCNTKYFLTISFGQ